LEKRAKELTDLGEEKNRLVSAIAEIRGGMEALTAAMASEVRTSSKTLADVGAME